MKEALFYTQVDNNKVKCQLCPHECILQEGKTGICRVRKSVKNTLISENYGLLSSVSFDPIEKKPLYHFFPGREILSMGSVGCNLRCRFCQNCDISQTGVEGAYFLKEYPIDKLLKLARSRKSNIGLAYTYNEPIVFYEYMLDVSQEIKKLGMFNVMVSNGYINPAPLEKLMDTIDACNIDLKAFTEEFYKHETSASLQPVLDNLKYIRKRKKHLEVTTLLIPGKNDDEKQFREMTNWIATELGEDTILHISRYFPRHLATAPPTSEILLHRFYRIAKESLHYVYIGNAHMQEGRDTFCAGCGNRVAQRSGYLTELTNLNDNGSCNVCGGVVFPYI